jgi:4'-phosphopantetheinyl transferase
VRPAPAPRLVAVSASAGTSAASVADVEWAPGPERPELPEGAVDVWRAELGSVDERLAELLCEEERARAERLLNERTRVLWTRSRGLLRTLLGRYLEADPHALRFVEDPRGKPSLGAPAGGSPPGEPAGAKGGASVSFNLSHSHTLALYAFSRNAPVGIDVEADRHPIDELAIAARMLGADAAAHLRAMTDQGERRREFLRAWTRYEAELKCLGAGIGGGGPGLGGRGLWVAQLEPGGDAAGAVACVREPRELRCWTWS